MPYIMYTPNPPLVAVDLEHPSISWGRRPPPKRMRSCHAIGHVQSSPDSEFHGTSTLQVLARASVIGSLALLLHFVTSFPFESISDSEYILEAPMSSESGAIHRRSACMGCAARCGEPTFFNDYQSVATHYSRSSLCNRSMREIKTVAVQLNTRPQHVGVVEAGVGGAAGSWRPQPAPSRRAGAMI